MLNFMPWVGLAFLSLAGLKLGIANEPSFEPAEIAPSPIIRTSLPTFKEGTQFVRFDGPYAELRTNDGKLERLFLGLEAPKYLGVLKTKMTGKPYFLFEGQPCTGCKMERKLYLFRGLETKPDLFTMPGRITHPQKQSLVFEARSFFGKCLNGYGDVLVTFQKENVDRRRGLRTSVLIAEPGEDHLIEKIHARRLPSVSTAVQRAKRGECTEILGKNRIVATRILDEVESLRTRGKSLSGFSMQKSNPLPNASSKEPNQSEPNQNEPNQNEDDETDTPTPLEKDFPDSEE